MATNTDQPPKFPQRKFSRLLGIESVEEFLLVGITVGAVAQCGAEKFEDGVTAKALERLHSSYLFSQERVLFFGIDIKAIPSELAFGPIKKPWPQMCGIREEPLDCCAVFMRAIKRALSLADACHMTQANEDQPNCGTGTQCA